MPFKWYFGYKWQTLTLVLVPSSGSGSLYQQNKHKSHSTAATLTVWKIRWTTSTPNAPSVKSVFWPKDRALVSGKGHVTLIALCCNYEVVNLFDLYFLRRAMLIWLPASIKYTWNITNAELKVILWQCRVIIAFVAYCIYYICLCIINILSCLVELHIS